MKAFEIADVPRDEVYRFVRGLHSDPFSVLGPHKVGDDVEIRVFRPDARAVEVVLDREPDKPIAAERSDEEGFFCATVPGAERDVPYHLRIVKLDGSRRAHAGCVSARSDHGRRRSASVQRRTTLENL